MGKNRKTILLADDEPEILKSIGEILERFGYNVIARPDGRAALSVIREGTPVDLVLVDYVMPGMDGLELLKSLKELAPDVPLVLFTGNSTIESYLKALGLGVHEYVNKPVTAQKLKRIVQAAIEKGPAGAPNSASHEG